MKDKKHMAERFLNHALGIIYLLTGEEYIIVKKNSPHCSISHLSGEIPVTCGDVSVYFSVEEWNYLEEHKDIYKDLVTEMCPPSTISTEIPEKLSSDFVNEKIATITIREDCEDGTHERDVETDTHAILHLSGSFNENVSMKSIGDIREGESVERDVRDVVERADIDRDGLYIAEEYATDLLPVFQEDYVEMSASQSALDNIGILPSEFGSYEWAQTVSALGKNVILGDIVQKKPKGKLTPGNKSVAKKTKDNLTHRSTSVPKKTKEKLTPGSNNFTKSTKEKPAKQLPGTTVNAGHHTLLARDPNACPDCGKYFHNKSNLRRHQKIHYRKVHKYYESGGQFHNKQPLHRRKAQAAGNLHRCNDCGKQFNSKSHLTSHQRVHTGEKPHTCNECGKCFGSKAYFIVHQRIHSGEKPYICSHCEKRFADRSNLRKHQRTHR
ncbi:zinc finger protein 347-like [Spea bombifrons]|uniref:zinc finger protein 347-like n=1 Tax=Spea bombifrons TaxID=233779 RepID=UPI00234ABC3A|nr:zinc finger protein 347-like [Spea bombifrons]